ncbi:MAG: tRNA uridine-5-carboxymethylaminomethyl(34) synthesis GTPase MnmE [Opitutaceae bacterium]|nr:tRNA uridine-5-carboxymethylaminomethyl(34) synthesis GTPase MnmE [Opitutaceae bacterium]
MSFPTDTIAALATPAGTSAIAVLRISGPETGPLTEALFGAPLAPRTLHRRDYRELGDTLVDDVLAVYFPAPKSFTGEDILEISCHGNPFIAQRILADLLARGCRQAEAGEFTKRAFLNGRMDLSQAEAVMDLIHARSERALTAANQQLRGALGRRMNELIALLVKVLAQIEAYIDFPDEDLPPEDRQEVLTQLEQLKTQTDRLLATNRYGNLLREGIRTVIVGEPNAGKSSLLNQLVGHERALVSNEPGTTRDYLEEKIVVGPHWLRLIDTAGLNPAAVDLERRGIEKTLEVAANADLYLWVLDSTQPVAALPPDLARSMTPQNTIAVLNKIDLPPARGEYPEMPFPTVRVSALLGAGLEALQAAIGKLADSHRADVGDDGIAVNVRHAQALREAGEALDRARQKLRDGVYSELVASELRLALDAYGRISGRIDNERMLDELFATFCIGK